MNWLIGSPGSSSSNRSTKPKLPLPSSFLSLGSKLLLTYTQPYIIGSFLCLILGIDIRFITPLTILDGSIDYDACVSIWV
jgi:hypothetical protein